MNRWESVATSEHHQHKIEVYSLPSSDLIMFNSALSALKLY